MKNKFRIAVLASGNGTNAEEIFRYFHHHANVEVVILLSNNPDAYVLERAGSFSIPHRNFDRQQFADGTVLSWLKAYGVTHIVLAGFLWLIPPSILEAFPNRVINIHPSLLPMFGGKGMYGMKVHQKVKEAGATETGITIHLVNVHYDEGKILFQAKCAVSPHDTPESIAAKVNQLEYFHFPGVIEKWIG